MSAPDAMQFPAGVCEILHSSMWQPHCIKHWFIFYKRECAGGVSTLSLAVYLYVFFSGEAEHTCLPAAVPLRSVLFVHQTEGAGDS